MADPEEQYDSLHWEIIDILREGRATPSYLSDRTGESRQLVSHRLRDLRLSGAVEKIHKGLYELDGDPGEREYEPDESEEPAVVERTLEGWSHGRNTEEQEASREIALKSLEWLSEQTATIRRSAVPLDQYADEDPRGRSPDSLWTEVVRDAWKHAAEEGVVERPTNRSWKWSGEDE